MVGVRWEQGSVQLLSLGILQKTKEGI